MRHSQTHSYGVKLMFWTFDR